MYCKYLYYIFWYFNDFVINYLVGIIIYLDIEIDYKIVKIFDFVGDYIYDF